MEKDTRLFPTRRNLPTYLPLTGSSMAEEDDLKKLVRPVSGFPNPAFVFGDITPLLASPTAFAAVIDAFTARYADTPGLVAVAAPEARGFFFGPPLAKALGCAFIPIRKEFQLPGPTMKASSSMDYGERTFEVHDAAVSPSAGKVVLVDDILATGGSALACTELLQKLGLDVVEVAIVYDYSDGKSVLQGKSKLEAVDIPVFKLATFCKDGDMRWWLERGGDEDVIKSPHVGKVLKQH